MCTPCVNTFFLSLEKKVDYENKNEDEERVCHCRKIGMVTINDIFALTGIWTGRAHGRTEVIAPRALREVVVPARVGCREPSTEVRDCKKWK